MRSVFTNAIFEGAALLNIKRLSGLLLLVTVMASVTACEPGNIKNEDSVFYAVPVGSSLVLNQDVTIPGEQVAIYVQAGKILSYAAVNKYQPNCKFEIYTINQKPRSVLADRFEIIKVIDDIESSAITNNTQLALLDDLPASLLARNVHIFGIFDQSEMLNYATLMYLHSAKQKDVYRMTCQHWESTLDHRHLSITQMRAAMGSVFTLNIKQ